MLSEIRGRLIVNPQADQRLRRAHSDIIKSTIFNVLLNFEEMETDELIELYGTRDYTGADLMYHANSDFIQMVDSLVSKSVDSFYTNKYDQYQSFSNNICY